MRLLQSLYLVLIPFLPFVLASQIPLSPPHTSSLTVIDLLSSSFNHTILLHLLQRTRLIPTLNLIQGVTVFAPTDRAWEEWADKRLGDGADPFRGSSQLTEMSAGDLATYIRAISPATKQDQRHSKLDAREQGGDGIFPEFADNILHHARSLMLYHLLNYTLPPPEPSRLPDYNQEKDYWSYTLSDAEKGSIITTTTTLFFPDTNREQKHPPSDKPPSKPPWAPSGGTGALGGKGQKVRILFEGLESDAGFGKGREDNRLKIGKVGVDHRGEGGAGVWDWYTEEEQSALTEKGNREGEGRSGDENVRVGSNGVVIGLEGVLDMPETIGEHSTPTTRMTWTFRLIKL